MANLYQQQIFQRKLIYLSLIVALLAGSWGFRTYAVERQARELGLLEDSHGDVELLGAAARTGLSGLRGIATCALWMQAMEQQKKNQYSALERTVKQLTRLQPHLNIPWVFQSWNLAYNVSRECDRVNDKYFYISRGIQLLAQGERQNRFQPELRRELAHYNQHKLCQSDENNTFRSLFQLSCIPPAQRDPEQLRPRSFFQLTAKDLEYLVSRGVPGDIIRKMRPLEGSEFTAEGFRAELESFLQSAAAAQRARYQQLVLSVAEKTDYEKLEQFCRAHPQLARRLHSPPLPYDIRREQPKFRCASAAELVQFLADNFTVPSLYVDRLDSEQGFKNGAVRDNPLERFPVLPPARSGKYLAEDPTADDFAAQAVPDDADPFLVGRAWYGYAQECVPPPGEIPGDNAPVRDPARERVPRNMQTILFRCAPARTQTFMAERLQEEGWYDDEPFTITGWFQRGPADIDRPAVIGVGRQWSSDAWRKANQMWRRFGLDNHLLFEGEQERANKERLAKAFRKEFNLGEFEFPRIDPSRLTAEQQKMAQAFQFLAAHVEGRRMTNFDSYLTRSAIEEQPRTVKARKLFYQADQLRLVRQERNNALDKFEDPDCILAWRAILEDNPEYRHIEFIQEQTYEVELKYINLYRRLNGNNLAPDLALLAVLGQSVAGAPAGADWTALSLFSRPQLQPDLEVVGPFDRDSSGQPFVPDTVKNTIQVARGLKKPTPAAGAPPPGMQPRSGMRPPQ